MAHWIYLAIGEVAYFIETETFPNMTLYRICVEVRKDWDWKIQKRITEDLEARHIKLMEEGLA